MPESSACALDATNKAAIWSCCDPPVQLLEISSETGFVRAKIGVSSGSTAFTSLLACRFPTSPVSWIRWWLMPGSSPRGHRSNSYTASDHLQILYTIGQQTVADELAAPRWKRYRVDAQPPERFSDLMYSFNTEGTAEFMANEVMDHLESTCNATMTQRKHYRRHHQQVYWWNDNIADLRRECNQARRRYQRSRGEHPSSSGR
ncbi:hypothetical protein ACLKA7_001783 [Drosophila subpalustris]